MNEEEKKAIEKLEIEGTENNYLEVRIALKLIDKLQKENKKLQEKRDIEVNYFCNRMNDVGENVEKVYQIKDEKIDKLQKENKNLKEEIDDLIKENHKHIDYITSMKKKHEDKIKSKEKQIKLMQEMNLPDEIEKNYVSKDKIRTKIKELEEKDKASLTNIYGYGIKFLKELLGGDIE